MTGYMTVEPRDPMIARDGRPFGTGARIHSLPWPYPQSMTGALRTLAGTLKREFVPEELKLLEVAGPFPWHDKRKQLFLPAPADLVRMPEVHRCLRARPARKYLAASNLPVGLAPCLLPGDLTEDFKPVEPPPFFSSGQVEQWLLEQADEFDFEAEAAQFCPFPEQERRGHVSINQETLSAEDAKLYRTTGLRFAEDMCMVLRFRPPESLRACLDNVDLAFPTGGERRLAYWKRADLSEHAAAWQCPNRIRDTLSQPPETGTKQRVRLMLASPAPFDAGWRPGWLDGKHEVPAGTGVVLKLVGACVPRWKAISGWSLEKGKFGAKPVRRLAPAGSVYFCEVQEGDPSKLASRWLESVCDREADMREGFGLALWGTWSEHNG